MSFSAVRSYFHARAVYLGYAKHYDGFATDNIPKTRFDRSFHVEAFNFQGSPQNNLSVDIQVPVVVKLYFKAFKDVDAGIAVASDAGEAFIEDVLASENRLQNSTFRNVIFDAITVEPYASSNDNFIVCRIQFTVLIFKGIC